MTENRKTLKSLLIDAASSYGSPTDKFLAAMIIQNHLEDKPVGGLLDRMNHHVQQFNVMDDGEVQDTLKKYQALWLVEAALHPTECVPMAQYMVGLNRDKYHFRETFKSKGYGSVTKEGLLLRAALAVSPVQEACALVHEAVSNPFEVKSSGFVDVLNKQFAINIQMGAKNKKQSDASLLGQYMQNKAGISSNPLSAQHELLVRAMRKTAGIPQKSFTFSDDYVELMNCFVCTVDSSGSLLFGKKGIEKRTSCGDTTLAVVNRMPIEELEYKLKRKKEGTPVILAEDDFAAKLQQLKQNGLGSLVDPERQSYNTFALNGR
jgi:hypothetical protein